MAKRRNKTSFSIANSLGAIGALFGTGEGLNVYQSSHQIIWFVIIFTGSVTIGVIIGVALDNLFKRILYSLSPVNRELASAKSIARDSSVPSNPSSNKIRPDDVILITPISQLSWQEFERLLALYFRDQGYDVEETGVGGKDGGVDLVLTKKRSTRRIAVQAKHYAEHRSVGPNVIRESLSAKMNIDPHCTEVWIITSSVFTEQARKEAKKRPAVLWDRYRLEGNLKKWPKWQGIS